MTTPLTSQNESSQQLSKDGLVADSAPASKPKKKNKVSKGAETLFRTTLSSHLRLSEMADRKANLMISINTIIISVVISGYTRKFDAPANLLVPSILLLLICLITIVISLIATNPSISTSNKATNDVSDLPIDLLFFGQYVSLTADEYRQKLRALLLNEEDLYTSLINNIYAQGQVLSRKYRLLKLAYQLFMIGFSVVVILVIITLCFTIST